MEFAAPDPERYRISDCGRYLIERISCGGQYVYCVWQYSTQRGGYSSMQDAKDAIMTREFHRFESAPEVGTVGSCPTCGKWDGAGISVPDRRERPREALEGDL